ncbi:hypothetical protein DQ238_15420 [Geodermatophilus sp. TF02-6]|uniref:FUSC family protein n=1 Tax=Geodermatophilus sp. TF02-6 TaxID=2250575 RepID=UPI000DEA73FC|nr:FUSC family protein [Geodermatophilus sp. TF02-6]RBY77276.1 hypothetical protein DQ238_15420 [Geodermatophilus sp. TF02-6]
MSEAQHPPAGRLVVAAVLVLAPIVAVACSPWSAFTAIVLFGYLAALNAALVDERAVALTVVVTTVVAFVAVLLTGTGPALPLLGTGLIALLAFATAAVTPHGLMSVGAVQIVLAAHLLIDPRGLDAGLGPSPTVWTTSSVLAGVVFAVAGWVLLVRLAVLPGKHAPLRVEPSIPYGTLLAVVCGLFALICLLWFRGTNMWWTVLTVALVLQPAAQDTRARAANRIVGTFVGATVAGIAVALIASETVVLVLAVVAAVACVVLTLAGSAYWLYSTAVTVSVMLLTFTPSGLLVGDVQRIVCTVVAAAASVVAVLLVEWFGPERTVQRRRVVGR